MIYWYICVQFLFEDEVLMHEGVTAVYKTNVDLFFCVLGAQNENEVYMSVSYLQCGIIYKVT